MRTRHQPRTWQRVTDRAAKQPIYWRNEYARGRGETLEARYQQYRDCMESLDREPMDFDSWLNT